IQVLKSTNAPLELTLKIGRENIIYLDLQISLSFNSIQHQLHQKPLSNKTFISPDSLNPQHMLKNVIYNELLRANRLCGQPENRNKHELNIMCKAIRA